jgi:recombination protein RecA
MSAKPKNSKPKKTAAPTNAEDAAKLAALQASLEKAYGKGIMQTMDKSSSNQRFERQTPSGSIGLDIALGPMFRHPTGIWQTGYAPGRIIEIFGPESGGKTTMCLQLVANAQAMGIRCAYNDMEHTLDPAWAKALGVRLPELYFTQPSSGTECLQIVDHQLRSGLFGVIVTDSVAALITEEELKGEMGDATMGGQARLMSQAMRKLNTFMTTNKAATNLVFVNQIRHKIGVMYGNPETTTGGNALKFYASFRIDVRRAEQLKDGENVYGHRIRAKVIKNKVAPPFREATFDLIYSKGIDYVAELFDLCATKGILVVGNAGWTTYKDRTLGQGKDNVANKMREDRALAYHLYDDLLTLVMHERGYTPDGVAIPGMVQEIAPTSQASAFQPVAESETGEGVEVEEVTQ